MSEDARSEAKRILVSETDLVPPLHDELVAALAAAIKLRRYLPDFGWGPAHEACGEFDDALSALRARAGEGTEDERRPV